MDRTELERAVRKLAAARMKSLNAKVRHDNFVDEFSARPEVVKALNEKIDAETEENLARKELSLMALEIFAQEKNKDIHPAVKIKVYTDYEYPEAYAQEWCKANFPAAFVFDNRKFESYLKICSPADVSFVKYIEDPRVTIATDLSEYLEGEK